MNPIFSFCIFMEFVSKFTPPPPDVYQTSIGNPRSAIEDHFFLFLEVSIVEVWTNLQWTTDKLFVWKGKDIIKNG